MIKNKTESVQRDLNSKYSIKIDTVVKFLNKSTPLKRPLKLTSTERFELLDES